jgi:hypothetical protein
MYQESGGVRIFRSEYEIIDVWSNVQFVEFETKKNIDQQMDNTSRFLPFLRLGEIDHDLCNSHLFCVLPSSSNTNINKQSTEGKIKNPLIIFCFLFEKKKPLEIYV